jgi:hypothetical protein
VSVCVSRGSRSAGGPAATRPISPSRSRAGLNISASYQFCQMCGEIPAIPNGTRLRIRAMGRYISRNCPAPKRRARLHAESAYGPRAMCIGGGLQELVRRGRPSAAKFLAQIFRTGDCTVEVTAHHASPNHCNPSLEERADTRTPQNSGCSPQRNLQSVKISVPLEMAVNGMRSDSLQIKH